MSNEIASPPGPEASSLKAASFDMYKEVCAGYHAIADFRAKLLGLLPLASAGGIFFLLSDALTDVKKKEFSAAYLVPIGIFSPQAPKRTECVTHSPTTAHIRFTTQRISRWTFRGKIGSKAFIRSRCIWLASFILGPL